MGEYLEVVLFVGYGVVIWGYDFGFIIFFLGFCLGAFVSLVLFVEGWVLGGFAVLLLVFSV